MARRSGSSLFGPVSTLRRRRDSGRRVRGLEPLETRNLLSADLSAAFDWPAPPVPPSLHPAVGSPYQITNAFGQTAAVDPFQAAPLAELQAGKLATDEAVWQDADLGETFSLHSNPSANHVIYLDFDGHRTRQTAWNSAFASAADIVTLAWSSDSNRASFNASERAMIQRIWASVAEDFAPFDVDVTTETPPLDDLRRTGTSDTRWGVRVVIGPNTWFDPAGGVAYIGSFGWASDTPCFVFNVGEAAIREAISHEVGHTLGLHHDGDATTEYYRGHGSGTERWAPIMGSSYSASRSQWSRGEYPHANNHEDDLEIISTQNGFGYRADDYGNTLSQAQPLNAAGTEISSPVYGRIERRDDRDVFSFWSDAGKVELQVDPLPFAANLDAGAILYDTSGAVIASSAPAGGTSATLRPTLTQPGQYFLVVTGTGSGSPLDEGYSDYGSLGHYRVQAQVVPFAPEPPDPGVGQDDSSVVVGMLNGSFEQGTQGWTATGDLATATASFGENPQAGTRQAVISNRNQSAGKVPVGEIEDFLGLPAGEIALAGTSPLTAGSAVRRTVDAQAGDVLTFGYNFLTNESTPAGDYNDVAVFVADDGTHRDVVLLADTEADGFRASTSTYRESTGYKSYQHRFTRSGRYTLGFAVIDAQDTGYDSALLLDDVQLHRATNAAPPPAPTGPAATLTNGDFAAGLSGWTATGHATADVTGLGSVATADAGKAWVSNANTEGGDTSAAELEGFLGLGSGGLSSLGDATATAGSAIRQVVDVAAGTTLQVTFRFLTNEQTPQAAYNDFAFLTVAGQGLSDSMLLADTRTDGFADSPTTYRAATGDRTVTYTFPESGRFAIGLGVSDAKDTSYDSALLIDSVRLVASADFPATDDTVPLAASEPAIDAVFAVFGG